MKELIKFEFLKLYKAKMNRIVVAFMSGMLLFIMMLCVTQSWETKNGENLSGFVAIKQMKKKTDDVAGILTEERITKDLQEYQRLWNDPSNKVNVGTMDENWNEEIGTHFWDDKRSYFYWLNHNYDDPGVYSMIDNINTLDFSEGAHFYETADKKIEETLEYGTSDWKYSEAEKSFWREKREKKNTPYTYGYAGGWQTILDFIAFMLYAVMAVCLMVAGTYAGEYSHGTDNIILTSKYGKSKVVTAKNIAAVIYGIFVLTIFVVEMCVGLLLCLGTEGADLPIQLCSATFTYPVTYLQAVLICIAICYVGCIGMTALTLFLSARMKSPLPVFAAILGLVIIGVLSRPSLTHGVYNHIRLLLPYFALNLNAYLFEDMLSYPFGKVVFDYPTMLCVVYGLLAVIFLPVAGRGFKRHQVQ